MAKTKISEWSSTPGSNTDIDGINIAEGCAPSGINDAIREMMSQVKDLYSGTTGDAIAIAGGGTGATTASAARTALGVAIGTDVQAYSANLTAYAATGIGFRNRIINGDMRIDQRNAGAAVTAESYLVDRWRVWRNQTYDIQQVTDAPTGFSNSLRVTKTSTSQSTYAYLIQYIEGFNFADMLFGTANAKSVTISFWVKSSVTGTFTAGIGNATGGAGSASTSFYPASYTISSANTWEFKTIPIPGQTSGTWLGSTNAAGASLYFNFGASGTATVNAWNSGDVQAASAASANLGTTNGATFYITGVQLEAGTVATPFERRDYGRELMMCQRYYEQVSSQLSGMAFSAANLAYSGKFQVSKRAAPTLTAIAQGTWIGNASSGSILATTFSAVSNNAYNCDSTSFTGSVVQGYAYVVRDIIHAASAEL